MEGHSYEHPQCSPLYGFAVRTLSFVLYVVGLLTFGSLFSFTLFVLLFFPALEDWRTGYISDGWSFLIGACGLFTAYFHHELLTSISSFGIGVFILGTLYFLFPSAIGLGDVFLFGALSLWLSPFFCVFSLWLSSVMALFYCFFGKKIKRSVRFAPFLCFAGGVSYGLSQLDWFPFWIFAR